MRPLESHFRKDALTTLETVLKQTKEARVFRRAQAVREVVAGQHVNVVSATLHFTNSALRKWVQRFAQQGPQGLVDRPRSGRPPKVTCALEQHLNRLVDQDPLEHGSLHSQWSCRELAIVLARETGVQLGRESVRGVLKKLRRQNELEEVLFKSCKVGLRATTKATAGHALPTTILQLLSQCLPLLDVFRGEVLADKGP